MIGAPFSNLTVGAFGFLIVALVFALIAGVMAWMNRDVWPVRRSL